MFRGHHPTRVDEKGRFKVPAEYKREIDEKYGAQFYITSRDGKIAKVYPLKVWERLEREMIAQSGESFRKVPERDELLRPDGGDGWAGQIADSGLLREKAGLKGDVAVVGKLERLEIRVAEEYRKQVEENPFTPEDDEALAKSGIW